MKTLALLASVAFFSGCVGTSAIVNSIPVEEKIPKTEEPIKRVVDPAKDPYPFVGAFHLPNGRFIGSGVVVDKRFVLTAAHVVHSDDPDRIPDKFRTLDGETYCVKEIMVHPVAEIHGVWINDIAVVEVERDIHVLPIKLKEPTDFICKRMPMVTCGYAGGVKNYSKPGVFTYLGRLIANPTNVIWIPWDATIWFGDSGGALMYTPPGQEEPKLVGLLGYLEINKHKKRVEENGATSIDYYYNWIKETMNGRAVQGVVR
tara:strand:+ start:82 stop:858 length:777 start_codon:yes stop_codon:yes gene_type:complete